MSNEPYSAVLSTEPSFGSIPHTIQSDSSWGTFSQDIWQKLAVPSLHLPAISFDSMYQTFQSSSITSGFAYVTSMNLHIPDFSSSNMYQTIKDDYITPSVEYVTAHPYFVAGIVALAATVTTATIVYMTSSSSGASSEVKLGGAAGGLLTNLMEPASSDQPSPRSTAKLINSGHWADKLNGLYEHINQFAKDSADVTVPTASEPAATGHSTFTAKPITSGPWASKLGSLNEHLSQFTKTGFSVEPTVDSQTQQTFTAKPVTGGHWASKLYDLQKTLKFPAVNIESKDLFGLDTNTLKNTVANTGPEFSVEEANRLFNAEYSDISSEPMHKQWFNTAKNIFYGHVEVVGDTL